MQSLHPHVSSRSSVASGRASCGLAPSRLLCRGIRGVNGDRLQVAVQQAAPTCLGPDMYEQALGFARAEAYEDARSAFEHLLTRQPSMCKAWVSWAQMEKRCHRLNQPERWQRCRTVLQRGLQLNPASSCLIQAWGLMELQRGNWLAAIMLLERSARLDDKCVPVLRWQHVRTAKKTVGSRSSASRGLGGSTSSTA